MNESLDYRRIAAILNTPLAFGRPEKCDDGKYVAYCVIGGCVRDPSKRGLKAQIDHWLSNHDQYRYRMLKQELLGAVQ
jgi:hypothetical protein